MGDPLVTFAVKEEWRAFSGLAGSDRHLRTLITGMGRKNADRSIRDALLLHQPDLVLTCGFAGGLNPHYPAGTVLFSADDHFPLSPALRAAGAFPATFHCAERVIATANEKRALQHRTRADAVEMESGVIRAVCRERGVPSATVRVISDAANEDLPLDFNRFMSEEQSLRVGRLGLSMAGSPWKIGALLRFHKQTRLAAERLARVLVTALPVQPPTP